MVPSRGRFVGGLLQSRVSTGAVGEAALLGDGAEADALEILVERGCYVPASSLLRLLRRCVGGKDLELGRRVDLLAVRGGYGWDSSLASCLVRMYCGHGRVEEARKVFARVRAPDNALWCSMVSAHALLGQHAEAVRLYGRMRECGGEPDRYAFAAVLKACGSVGDLASGREVHAHLLRSREEPDVVLGNCLVGMYGECGRLEDARAVFEGLGRKDVVSWTAMVAQYAKCGEFEEACRLLDAMPVRTVVSWNALMAGYAQHGFGREALDLYARMQSEGGCRAGRVTFACVLKACASVGDLQQGKLLHVQIRERGLERDWVVGNGLVDMYAKCGRLEHAREVFDALSTKDVVVWTAMIAGYAQQGLGAESLVLYEMMQREGITPANQVTFVCLLKACSSLGALRQGRALHLQIRERGLEGDLVVGNCLVDMYAKCGSLEDARTVFDGMCRRDVVTWTAIIAGYSTLGRAQEALALYVEMQNEGITPANHVTYVCLLKACGVVGALCQGKQLHGQIQAEGLEADATIGSSLVDMYAKCGSLEDARVVFDRLPVKDAVTWNAMIAGFAQHGPGQESLKLFLSMQKEGIVLPDHATFVCLLKACASIGVLREGRKIHSKILERELHGDVVLGNGLVDLYSKCGSLEDARRVFDGLPARDVVTWNAMFTGYSQHGLGQEILTLYTRMQQEGITPADQITFACVLKACARIGALHLGKQLHSQIRDQGLENDLVLGNCLLYMYGKCGNLEEARKLFDRLPMKGIAPWNAMIAGYAQHGLGEEALQCYEKMLMAGIKPDKLTFLSLLSACSHVGLVDKGVAYFQSMSRDYGLTAEIEHYVSMVDLYGRAGCFTHIKDLLSSMPMQPDLATWLCLLGACRKHGNVVLGHWAFSHAVHLQPDHASTYILMSHIYAAAGLFDRAQEVHGLREKASAWKTPGQSWIEHEHELHRFSVGDVQHADHEQLYDLLEIFSPKPRNVELDCRAIRTVDHVSGYLVL